MRRIVVLLLVALVLVPAQVLAKAPDDNQCIAEIRGFPHVLREGYEYVGEVVVTNQTETLVWFDLVYNSNLGDFNPQSSYIMGLPGIPRSVGVTLYSAEAPSKGRRGFFETEIWIDGATCRIVEDYMTVVPH